MLLTCDLCPRLCNLEREGQATSKTHTRSNLSALSHLTKEQKASKLKLVLAVFASECDGGAMSRYIYVNKTILW